MRTRSPVIAIDFENAFVTKRCSESNSSAEQKRPEPRRGSFGATQKTQQLGRYHGDVRDELGLQHVLRGATWKHHGSARKRAPEEDSQSTDVVQREGQ